MLKKINRIYDKINEIPFYKIAIFLFVISTIFSLILISHFKNLVDTGEEKYVFLETNVKNMVDKRDFSNNKNIIIKSCNHDLLNDILTLEAKYKNVSVSAKVMDYSGTEKQILIERINSVKEIGLTSIIIISIIIGFGTSIVLFLAFSILISIIHSIINHIFT